jgi:hypothetical protein
LVEPLPPGEQVRKYLRGLVYYRIDGNEVTKEEFENRLREEFDNLLEDFS